MRYNKAITLFLMACLLMAIACTAVADSGAKPILFRDLPWGATYAEVIEAMPDGLKFEVDYLGNEETFPKSFEALVTGEGMDEGFTGPIIMGAIGTPEAAGSVKVAGYGLNSMILIFAHTAKDDGMLARDEEHTAFVIGAYGINPANLVTPTKVDECFDDLTAKLTMLYGEPETTVQLGEGAQSGMTKYTAWRGAEESNLYLSTDGQHSVELLYWSAEGEKLVKEAYDALTLSVDGL